jgi:hypothetical protein
MVTDNLPASEAAPAYNSLLPLYFIVFAWVVGWTFGHRFTEWPVDRGTAKSDANLGQETVVRTIRTRLPSGLAGFTVLAFGAIAAWGVNLNIAPKGGTVICTGMLFNSIIQLIAGYKSGLMTKSVSIWRQLHRATIGFEMGDENSLAIIVGRIHSNRNHGGPPGSWPSAAPDEDLHQAQHACFAGASSFACLWVITVWLMSTIGLSRGAEGLYVIVPSFWAMACLSIPIGKLLAVLLDPWRIRSTTF